MAITECMQAHKLDYTSAREARGSKYYSAFKEKLPALRAYLKNVGDEIEQRALLRLGVELLLDDIEATGAARAHEADDGAHPSTAGCRQQDVPTRPKENFT